MLCCVMIYARAKEFIMNILSIIMYGFAILGVIDRIIGNKFGLGREFERGFIIIGNSALAMIGMLVIAPALAVYMMPLFEAVNKLGIDSSIIPAGILANDMGAAPLASAVGLDPQIKMLNGLVVSTMMGCTISFTIPIAMQMLAKEHHKDFFFGTLCGIITIPIGSFAAGLICKIPIGLLLSDLLPLIVFAVIIAVGIIFAPSVSVKIFSVVGKIIRILISVGLAVGIMKLMVDWEFLDAYGTIAEGGAICISAAVVLSGAFPLMFVLSKLIKPLLIWIGKRLSIGENAAMGFISSLVTNVSTFEMMNHMNKKGVVLNAAFAVSASFVLASHLAFTTAYDSAYVTPMIVGKLTAGALALLLAAVVYPLYAKKEKA